MTVTTDVLSAQFTLEEMRGVVDEAHRCGLPVAAHAHALPAVEICVAAGVDDIEHCSCIVPGGLRTPVALAKALAEAGTIVCPTLGRNPASAEPPPQVRAMMKRTGVTWEARLGQVGELYRAGVKLVSGSDGGISAGKVHGLLPEAVIELVTGCGVPATYALASATGAAADAVGLAGRTGRLRRGLDADLLLVDGDPASDVTALRKISAVVSRGVVFGRHHDDRRTSTASG